MSTDQLPLLEVLHHPAFLALTAAVRQATVIPHISRERRRQSGGGERYPFDPDYDLVSTLQSAADRGPEDFLREFYGFASRYNDETARPGHHVHRRLLRTEELAQLATWMQDRHLRTVVPYALLAFGTSLKPKQAPGASGDTGENNQEDSMPDDGEEAPAEEEE